MKICLYLDLKRNFNGVLYKNIGSGIISAYKNQERLLKSLKIDFSDNIKDSWDILQINLPGPLSILQMKKARKNNKKIIAWSHMTAEDFTGVFRIGGLSYPITKKYLAYVYNLADLVFSPSEYTKGLLVSYGIPEEKIVVMSNGVDLKIFRKDKIKRKIGREKHGAKGITIGTASLVVPRKGVDTFLSLVKQFPDNQFLWFGKIYNSFLAKALPKDLPKNIDFKGYVQDVNEALNALDIFLFPSYEENQGMAIIEAAAVGLPLLIRDLPVYKGWLIHQENCLKAKNDKEFKKYLNLLIKDKNLRERLGKNALKMAQDEDILEIAKKTKRIYENLLQ